MSKIGPDFDWSCIPREGTVIDEAGSFEERLVVGSLDLTKADRSTALRTVGGALSAYTTSQPQLAWSLHNH